MGDVDLYGDLEFSPVLECNEASTVAAETGECGDDDGEAVGALVKLLEAAEGGASDDELWNEDVATDSLHGNVAEVYAPSATIFDVDEDDSPVVKKPRLDVNIQPQPSEAHPRVQKPQNTADDDFDFEADIPASSQEIAPRPTSFSRGVGHRRQPRALSQETKYQYNPTSDRWEVTTPSHNVEHSWATQRARKGKGMSGKGGRGHVATTGPGEEYKAWLCRNFAGGWCTYAERCFYAHGEHELRGSGLERLKFRNIAQCVIEARGDAKNQICEYPQALVVRLAVQFETRAEDILNNMAKVGLPVGHDRRTTVKALLRLCHPDKCHHPEAKRAVQILGPLL